MFESKVATQSCVYREYGRLKMQPWGAPRLRVDEVCLPTLTTWGLPVMKSRSLVTSLEGTMVLNAEL